jgi:hypothetical protein
LLVRSTWKKCKAKGVKGVLNLIWNTAGAMDVLMIWIMLWRLALVSASFVH